MQEIPEDLQALQDEGVGPVALDVSHETDATGVMFETGVVETLGLRKAWAEHGLCPRLPSSVTRI
jgi:hypothetical protein